MHLPDFQHDPTQISKMVSHTTASAVNLRRRKHLVSCNHVHRSYSYGTNKKRIIIIIDRPSIGYCMLLTGGYDDKEKQQQQQ
jgi:hypothetical protein